MDHQKQPEGFARTDSIVGTDLLGLSNRRNFSQNMEVLGMLSRASSDRPDLFQGISQTPIIKHLESSEGNIFKGFHQDEPIKTPPPKTNLTDAYAIECLEYEKYSFDSRIKLIIKKMSIQAYNLYRNEKESEFIVFPIQKLLTTIAKKLLLNRF